MAKDNRPEWKRESETRSKSHTGNRSKNGRRGNNTRRNGSNKPSENGGRNERKEHNSPSWYSLNDTQAKAAYQISTFNRAGARLEVDNAGFTTPGICVLNYMPTFGRINDVSSPLNQMMRTINQLQRASNAGSTNYMMADQFMVIMAVHSIYALYAHIGRTLKFWRAYNSLNTYYPDEIVEALGFNPSQFTDDTTLPWAWAEMSILASAINSFWIPKGFAVTERTMLLNSNVFIEGTVEKAPIYAFVPTGVYMIDDTSNPNGTMLKYVTLSDRYNLEDYIGLLWEMVNALQMMETAGTIFGDILKAFGNENCTKIEELKYGEDVVIAASAEMLWQIHNSYTVGLPATNLDVTQSVDKNMIYHSPRFRGKPHRLYNPILLDFDKDAPSTEEVAVYTRLCPAGCDELRKDSNGYFFIRPKSYGSEVVTSYRIYTFSDGIDNLWKRTVMDIASVYYADEADEYYKAIYAMNMFNLHPAITLLESSSDEVVDEASVKSARAASRIFDVHNYTTVDSSTMGRMHECALRGLFTMR